MLFFEHFACCCFKTPSADFFQNHLFLKTISERKSDVLSDLYIWVQLIAKVLQAKNGSEKH